MARHRLSDIDGFWVIAILFLILLFWLMWRNHKGQTGVTQTTQAGVTISDIGEATVWDERITTN